MKLFVERRRLILLTAVKGRLVRAFPALSDYCFPICIVFHCCIASFMRHNTFIKFDSNSKFVLKLKLQLIYISYVFCVFKDAVFKHQ